MPITYHCDTCGATAPTRAGWLVVSVLFIHYEPGVQPSGRTLDETAPDLLFHAAACRDAWCAKAGLPVPVAAPAAEPA
jgi:hypothetical protein